MKKISVIIPVYNVEQYLAQCLENIIHQTYNNLEIICINDGSLDNSKKILKHYAKLDKRIKVINQQNSGQSIARNTGIKNATGNYIHFMDSDDYIPLNYYEEMIKSLANTNADIVCSGFYFEMFCEKSICYKERFIYTTLIDKLQNTYAKYYNYIWRYLIKTSFIKKNNFYFTEHKIFEDIEYNIHLLTKANKVVTAPNIQYFYRYNKESTVNKKSRNYDVDYRNAKNNAKEILKQYNITLTDYEISAKYYRWKNKTILKKIVYFDKTQYILLNFIKWKMWHIRLSNLKH